MIPAVRWRRLLPEVFQCCWERGLGPFKVTAVTHIPSPRNLFYRRPRLPLVNSTTTTAPISLLGFLLCRILPSCLMMVRESLSSQAHSLMPVAASHLLRSLT